MCLDERRLPHSEGGESILPDHIRALIFAQFLRFVFDQGDDLVAGRHLIDRSRTLGARRARLSDELLDTFLLNFSNRFRGDERGRRGRTR